MPMPAVVPSPPAMPPRYGLIAAAAIPDDDARWEFGATWEPEACGGAGSGPWDCAPLDPRNDDRTTPGTVVSWPILLWGTDTCSTLGGRGRDWQGRARRLLEATQSAQLARELWAGEITQATQAGTDESPYLADADVVVLNAGTGLGVNDALALLEQAAGECSSGRRQMLHMAPQVLATALGDGSSYIARDGALLTTALGSIVVADAGYPGTNPDADAGDGNHWIFSSSLVQVRLGAVEVKPSSLDDARELAAVTDRPVNTLVAWAERTALYQLDPCCRFAVQTDVPIPDVPAS